MQMAAKPKTLLSLEECLGVVEDVSRATASSQDPSTLASNLLRLLPCLESPHLSSEDLSTLRHRIWRDDLLHLVIEVLRDEGQSKNVRTLADLAVILASVVSGLSPKEGKKPTSAMSKKSIARAEQVREYYDILLPTATDSVLILANNILEALDATADSATTQQQQQQHHKPESLAHFEKAMESLVWLCCGHKRCIPRALHSPYFLSMLITDHHLYSHVILSSLKTLVLTDKHSVASISQDVLSSILDELVYKLSGIDVKGARLSVQLLAQLSISLPSLVDTLSNSYAGLLTLVSKWTPKGRDNEESLQEFGAAEKYLIAELESRTDGKEEFDEKRKAAVFIQASWRGYASRKKMLAAKRGIARFQQLYRKRKSLKLEQKETQERSKMEVKLRQTHLKSSQLAFHTKQLSLYEQLPAAELQTFVHKQEVAAAVKIQSAWRGFAARARCKQMRRVAVITRSVIVIQRAFRRRSKAKQLELELRQAAVLEGGYLPKLSKPVRERLQREIARYRDANPPGFKTPEQLTELHLEAQREYEKFHFTQASRVRQDTELRQLISKLNWNCELLLTAPSLRESLGVEGLADTFSSRSSSVAKMGRTAHREELRAMDTPWWKRVPLDQEELTL